MRRIKIFYIFVLLSVLLFCSCSETIQKEKKQLEPNETTTEKTVDNVGTDISDIGILDKDLDMSELDDIDRDLEDISGGW